MADAETAGTPADQNPRKTLGYKELLKLPANALNLAMVRRFDEHVIRVILHWQDEVVCDEEELRALDEEAASTGPSTQDNGTFRRDRLSARTNLLLRSRQNVREFYRLVLDYMTLTKQDPPTARDVESVGNWLDQRSHLDGEQRIGPIDEAERAFLDAPDLVALAPEAKSPVLRFFEQFSCFRSLSCWRQQPHPSVTFEFDDPSLVMMNSKRVGIFVKVATWVIGSLMLIGPLFILFWIRSPVMKLIAIAFIVVFFFGMVICGTNPRSVEALMAVVGYSAVLMVFLGSAAWRSG